MSVFHLDYILEKKMPPIALYVYRGREKYF